MSFWTALGLQNLAQTESGGDPTIVNSSGHAGLYQYSTSTWQEYAKQAGVDTSIYPTADVAPASVQTQVASVTPISNWTCPGCNAWATTNQYDPTLVSDVAGTGATVNTGFGADIAGSVAMGDNPYQTVPTGSAIGAPGALGSSTGSSWFATIFTYIENMLARGGLMILAVVMVAIGLIFVMKDHGGEVAKAVR